MQFAWRAAIFRDNVSPFQSAIPTKGFSPGRGTCGLLVLLVLWGVAATLSAQTSTPHRALPPKNYCHPNAGFCFSYPNSWTMLGDVFDGNGVVVAPEQKEDRALWDEITVALMATPRGDGAGPSLNGIIEQAAAAMREAGQNFETLQRRELTVDHSPAQMLKAHYRENSTSREWIEELVFIQGPEDEIYSVALKCAPEHLSRLEPALKEVLASWSVPEPEPPAADAPADEAPPASPPKPEER